MSIKIKRFPTIEGGDFSVANNKTLAHIRIPASVGFSDLKNSRVVFNMTAECTQNDAAGNLSRVLPCFLGQVGTLGGVLGGITTRAGGAACLINRARVTSDTYGLLSEQEAANVVNPNLDEYVKYTEEHKVDDTFSGGGDYNECLEYESNLPHSAFLVYKRPNTIGAAETDNSQQRYTEVSAPLSCIDSFAHTVTQFPNMAVGDVTYEINLEKIIPVVGLGNIDTTLSNPIANMNAVASEIGSAANPLIFTAPKGGTFDSSNLASIPFYVGMPVRIAYTETGQPAATHDANIESLEVDSGTKHLKIILDTPAATVGATTAVTAITSVLHVDAAATFRYHIKDIYVELHCLQLTPSQLQSAQASLQNMSIDWVDCKVTALNLNTTGSYNESVYVDPMCAGLAVLLPQAGTLLSGFSNANRYSYLIDGKQPLDREIPIGPVLTTSRGLHNHLIQKWFGNIGRKLVKFDRPRQSYSVGTPSEATHAFFPVMTPMIPQRQLVNFKLNCPTGSTISSRTVYYAHFYPKSLTFKNGRLQ